MGDDGQPKRDKVYNLKSPQECMIVWVEEFK